MEEISSYTLGGLLNKENIHNFVNIKQSLSNPIYQFNGLPLKNNLI